MDDAERISFLEHKSAEQRERIKSLGLQIEQLNKACAERNRDKSTLWERLDIARKNSLTAFMKDQEAWSRKTFGNGKRTEGTLKHIEKEIAEVRAKPDDLSEWIDIVILALDGYWRHGGKDAIGDIIAKGKINRSRTYLMPASDDEPSEHVR